MGLVDAHPGTSGDATKSPLEDVEASLYFSYWCRSSSLWGRPRMGTVSKETTTGDMDAYYAGAGYLSYDVGAEYSAEEAVCMAVRLF